MERSFNVEIAKAYGVKEAIIVDFFLSEWEKRTPKFFYDGTFWVRLSAAEIEKELRFLTVREIRYAIQHLIKADVIKTGHFNLYPQDRTLSYGLTSHGRDIIDATKEG